MTDYRSVKVNLHYQIKSSQLSAKYKAKLSDSQLCKLKCSKKTQLV